MRHESVTKLSSFSHKLLVQPLFKRLKHFNVEKCFASALLVTFVENELALEP